jgi:Putative esterase
VRILSGLIVFSTIAAAFQPAASPTAKVEQRSHRSQVMGDMRGYRVFLPPAYQTARATRYPVIYWFHGYEAEDAARDAALAAFVAAHPVLIVDSGPVDTTGSFPLYFPELIDNVDQTFRTLADRDHRAVTGIGAGGFLGIWQAAKCPDLVGSASSFHATPEASIGPEGFDVDTALADLLPTLDAVRIRQVEATASIAETLSFHLDAFAHPRPKPVNFSHADPYPNFGVWNWEVVSDRRQPGFTMLESVGKSGFRSAVREWIPSGAALVNVKLTVTSASLYTPAAAYPVKYIRLRDGNVRQTTQKADARGRLTFELDGDSYEVGVGPGAAVALSGYEVSGASWATAGKPTELRLHFWNKGATRSGTRAIKWESPAAGIQFGPVTRLYGLAPGETASVSLTFTAASPAVSGVRLIGDDGENRVTLDVPVYPDATPFAEYKIADGLAVPGYAQPLGDGNRDGHAAPGEAFAVLIPEAGTLHAAELFTNDACVDNTVRIAESGSRISIPAIRASCEPGHRIQMLARVGLSYYSIEIPVWYRNP